MVVVLVVVFWMLVCVCACGCGCGCGIVRGIFMLGDWEGSEGWEVRI